MLNKVLEKIGLSGKESAIYLALLKMGASNISEIAKKTGIHRPLIYKELPGLLEKGLIVKVPKGQREYYCAESPDKLESLFETLKTDFTRALPDLRDLGKFSRNKPTVTFLEGKKGISSVFLDIVTSLKRGDIFYRYSSLKDMAKVEPYLPKNYREIRDQKQLERLVITNQDLPHGKRPKLERHMRVLFKDSGFFDFDIIQIIYGNKVALLDFNSETAVVVESSINAEFQKKIFKLLFNSLEQA